MTRITAIFAAVMVGLMLIGIAARIFRDLRALDRNKDDQDQD